uniref:Uncharacterized protein n=1 Tax=Utricularia reniformis TaxID=192314 RepID=A0A1Y0B082_9LAMI|nr:hypothetical protein AEK19_MT0579 [Utricularia reniformis]ART30835.1 hypothetical protein AEK19_MT0579 [Utricularia reniformis]
MTCLPTFPPGYAPATSLSFLGKQSTFAGLNCKVSLVVQEKS